MSKYYWVPRFLDNSLVLTVAPTIGPSWGPIDSCCAHQFLASVFPGHLPEKDYFSGMVCMSWHNGHFLLGEPRKNVLMGEHDTCGQSEHTLPPSLSSHHYLALGIIWHLVLDIALVLDSAQMMGLGQKAITQCFEYDCVFRKAQVGIRQSHFTPGQG